MVTQTSGGNYAWNTAPSGTAGNAISFTQAMTLDASGRLGIGVTSPSQSLHVAGTSTSAVIVGNADGTTKFYQLSYNNSQANSRSWRFSNDVSVFGDFAIQQSTTQTGSTYASQLYFSNSGAATFSSSVTAKSSIAVSNNGAESPLLSATSTFADGYRATLRLSNTHTGGKAWEVYSTNDSDGGYGGGKLAFVNTTNSVNAMTLTGAGNVGIGTTSPSQILDVRKATASGDTQFNFVNSQNSSSGNTSITSSIYLGFFDDSNGLANANKIVSGKSGDYTSAPTANSFLAFHTTSANSTAERMRITSGGNLLVNTTTDLGGSNKLQVNGVIVAVNDYISTRATSNSTQYGFVNAGDGNLYVGNVGGAAVGRFAMATGVYVATSDKNKKKDFEISNLGLDAIMGLKPTLYRMKSENGTQKHLGFVAQEVKEYIPQAYVQNNEFIGLSEMPIIAALTKALQELKQELDTLKNK
jgi:hypothetical protein